jgi:multidrug efflux pump subunit AcrA (membrane-fusion protein)
VSVPTSFILSTSFPKHLWCPLAKAFQDSAFATIQQLDPIYVDATQSSANLLQFKRNIAAGRINGIGTDRARVKLLLEDGTPYSLQGTLKFSEVTVDPSTGSFILRMVFPNPKHILLPGMYVRAVVQEGEIDKAILVPQQGVSRDPKGNPITLIVDENNKVALHPLELDRAIGERTAMMFFLNHAEPNVKIKRDEWVRVARERSFPFRCEQSLGLQACFQAQKFLEEQTFASSPHGIHI